MRGVGIVGHQVADLVGVFVGADLAGSALEFLVPDHVIGQIGRDAAGPGKVVLVGPIGFGAEEEELEGPLETRCLVAVFDAHAL